MEFFDLLLNASSQVSGELRWRREMKHGENITEGSKHVTFQYMLLYFTDTNERWEVESSGDLVG